MNSYEACDRAAELLVLAGFELRYQSMRSEARYYPLPEMYGLLRVACHSSDSSRLGGVDGTYGPVVARLTFDRSPHGISEDNVTTQTALAVGWYILRLKVGMRYKGKLRLGEKKAL